MVVGPALQVSTDPSTVALGVLTQLGDTWFLALLAVLCYWLGPHAPVVGPALDRDRAATVLALVLLAVALSAGLKGVFAIERPPGAPVAPTVPSPTVESTVAWLTGAEGHAFPSGHAVLASAAWGGFAWAIRRGAIRTRVGVVTVVVLAVGASRVGLGLHTPVQVVAGFAVGLAALAVVLVLGRATRAFALAFGVAAGGILAVGPLPELLVVAGLSGGASVAWYEWYEPLTAPIGKRAAAIALVGGFLSVLPAVGWLASVDDAGVVHVAAGAVAGALLVALPLVGEWLAENGTKSGTTRA